MSLGTVLVVDDEGAVRQGVAEVLTSRGYEVLLVASGPEALVTLEQAVRLQVSGARDH